MGKIDFKKELKEFYNASAKEPAIVTVPPFQYLMVDGRGDPNTSPESAQAIETLYPIAYALKFMIKKEQGIDYGVMPLEGLWWTDDMNQFTIDNKDIWRFTYMIMQPEYITSEMVKRALEDVAKKKKLPVLNKIRFEAFHEGTAAQIVHIGPFSAEGPTIERLHNFIRAKGYSFNGLKQKHHEIYLSDYRKVAPEKMKTILRQPFQKP